jgi:chromatin remodeling complex protein RSC6
VGQSPLAPRRARLRAVFPLVSVAPALRRRIFPSENACAPREIALASASRNESALDAVRSRTLSLWFANPYEEILMATKKAKKAAKKAPAKKAAKKAAPKKAAAKKAAPKKAAAKKTAPTKKAAKKKVARKPNAAFMKPLTPSGPLAAIIGSTPMPRTEVTSKIWAYIKKNKLQDAVNKRMINADEKLKELFGKAKADMFELTKYVSKHLK